MLRLRNSAKAIVIEDGRLLVTRNVDADGDWYLLPGGGQDPGETLTEALRRECREEIGADVLPGEIVFIREYRSWNHEFAKFDPQEHQIEFMFTCCLVPGEVPGQGSSPDADQTGVAWLPLADLPAYRLYPAVFRTLLQHDLTTSPVYLGDVN